MMGYKPDTPPPHPADSGQAPVEEHTGSSGGDGAAKSALRAN